MKHELKREYCRRCNDKFGISQRADFILWGKLFPQDAIGPTCYDHAAEHVDMFRVDQWAVYDLRPVNEILDKETKKEAGR